MKKLLIAFIFGLSYQVVQADNIIEATLIDHVMPVTQFRSNKTKLALLDSVILIGKIDNKSILDLQLGFNGDVKPEHDKANSADFVAGAFLKVSSIINSHIVFPQHWEFLRALEHGAFIQYDWRDKNVYGGYQAGLSFKLNPNK